MEHNAQPRQPSPGPRPAELEGLGTPCTPATRTKQPQNTGPHWARHTGRCPGEPLWRLTPREVVVGEAVCRSTKEEHKEGSLARRGRRAGRSGPQRAGPSSEASVGPPEQGGASLRAFSSFLSPACSEAPALSQTGSVRLKQELGLRVACVRTFYYFGRKHSQSENESSVIPVNLPAACPSSLQT